MGQKGSSWKGETPICDTSERHARLGDPRHVLSVRVFSQERRSADYDVDTVNSRLHSDSCIVHVASDVSQDLGLLEAELADGLAVCSRLWGGGGRGQLDVLHTELVKPGVSARHAPLCMAT